LFSVTPKQGIVSERGKQTTRPGTMADSLNLSLVPAGRRPEAASLAKPEKPKEKDKERATVKKDYELNDMHKMIQFLGKDKNLQSGKLELKEKLKRFRNDFKQSDVMPDDNEDHLEGIDVKITIGVGSYAVVKYGIDKTSKEPVAIKFYDKVKMMDPIKQRNYEEEVSNLKELNHPNVIKLYEVIEGRKKIALVMEYIGSNSLFEHTVEHTKGKLAEAEAKIIFFQIFKAIEYTHAKHIIHRDLKLQNIIVGNKNLVKLIDYGFSIKIEADSKLSVFCGTPSYMSPEIVKRIAYDGKASDVWALGICLYRTVAGSFPFKGINESDLYLKIKAGLTSWPKSFSPELKDLLQGLLHTDEKERLTAGSSLRHSFFHDLSLPEESTRSAC
jgi:serine/threonine protein kinase